MQRESNGDDVTPDEDRRGRYGEISSPRLRPLIDGWDESPLRAAPALLRLRLPGDYGARDLELMRAELRVLQAHCRASP